MHTEAIKDWRTYAPSEQPDKRLLDDNRILVAWYNTLKRSGKESLSNGIRLKDIVELQRRVRREMERRGFSPKVSLGCVTREEILRHVLQESYQNPVYILGGVPQSGFSHHDVDVFVDPEDRKQLHRACGSINRWVHVVRDSVSLAPGASYLKVCPSGRIDQMEYIDNVSGQHRSGAALGGGAIVAPALEALFIERAMVLRGFAQAVASKNRGLKKLMTVILERSQDSFHAVMNYFLEQADAKVVSERLASWDNAMLDFLESRGREGREDVGIEADEFGRAVKAKFPEVSGQTLARGMRGIFESTADLAGAIGRPAADVHFKDMLKFSVSTSKYISDTISSSFQGEQVQPAAPGEEERSSLDGYEHM